ncbi:hypothetical protein [Actinoplanes solisilvae]|uniref:hypothetical protein n=1 Tax=Actinoplanes solisilvae TaxID=2486853 RepID=UPI000FD76D1C|nr:hypothetical protein [Actinoplanes solisilvae]
MEIAAALAESMVDLRGVAYARNRQALVLWTLGRVDECRTTLPDFGDDLLAAFLRVLLNKDRLELQRVLAAAGATGDRDVETLAAEALTAP